MPRILFLAEGSNCLVVIEDYIEGQTVGDLIVSKQLTERRSVDIICQILRILLHLHGLPDPIIHRDIKPSNLIVDPKGEVYLLDMNAAKWYEPDLIDDGNYLGTRYFAAPEQVGYGLKASSAKSDIYAVGILLNVMLTGVLPKEKPAEGAFRDIIEKCTKLEADQRYSAEELLAVEGAFSSSGFVQSVTGVDNVCERAAMKEADSLLIRKQAADGVTVAAAVESAAALQG